MKKLEKTLDVATLIFFLAGAGMLIWTHFEDGYLLLVISLCSFLVSGFVYVNSNDIRADE